MTRLLTLAVVAAIAGGAFAFSYEEARALYVKNYTESSPSVQECGDYVFVIQEGLVDYDDPSGIKAAVLKGQLDAIEKYVGKSVGGTESPFPEALTGKLLPLNSFRIPACKSCKVDELRLVGKFRHVSAFEAAPLREARARAASGRPARLSNGEWGALIAERIKSYGSEEDRDSLWAELGAAPVLMSRLGGVRWMVERADGVTLCDAIVKWRGSETAKECYAVLKLNPAFSPAYRRLAALAEAEGDLVVALSRSFKASIAASAPEGVSALAGQVGKRFSSSAWGEYARLYAQAVQKSTLPSGESAAMWKYLVRTFGHLEASSVSAADAAKAAEMFKEGQLLFSEGRELEKLIGLFERSLELDPSVSERWRYYAAALRAAGRDLDAAVVYNQVLSMNPRDAVALADLGVLCGKLGFPELAKGCAWYVLATSSDETVRTKAESVLAK